MLNNKTRTDMKKKYNRPHIEEITFSTESILAGSKVGNVSGLGDETLTIKNTDQPTSFSKENKELWDFDEEN